MQMDCWIQLPERVFLPNQLGFCLHSGEKKKTGKRMGKKNIRCYLHHPVAGKFQNAARFQHHYFQMERASQKGPNTCDKKEPFLTAEKKWLQFLFKLAIEVAQLSFFWNAPPQKKKRKNNQNSQATLCSMKSSKGGKSLCFLASCHASKTPARIKESVHAFCCTRIKPAFRSRDVIRVAWRWIELRGSSSLVEWSQVSHNVHLVPETPRSSKVSSAEALLSTKNLRAFNRGFWRNTAP